MNSSIMNGRRSDRGSVPTWLIVLGSILGVIVLVVGIGTAVVVSTYQGIRHEGVTTETHLMGTYAKQEIVYNQMATTVADSMNIAGAQKDAAIAIFTAAMKGRFGDNPTQAQIMSFTVENYPNADISQKTYADIMTTMANNREKFAQAQQIMIDAALAYDRWLRADWPNSVYIGLAHFPSDQLTVERDGTTLTGWAALRAFEKPLLTGTVKQRFDNNTDGSLVPSSAPVATPSGK